MDSEYTATDYRRFIAEILEKIEDIKFLSQIYSLVAIRNRKERERRGL